METKNIGFRIQQLRKYLKLSQQLFADEIGASRSYLATIETGKEPSFNFIMSVLETTGVSSEWLLKGNGEMFSSKTAPQTQAIVEMIDSLDDSQKQKIYNVIEDAKQLQEMKERINQLLQLQTQKTA